MTRILADYEYLAVASNDLALVAHFLDRRTYLHFNFLSVMCFSFIYHAQPQAIVCFVFRCKGGLGLSLPLLRIRLHRGLANAESALLPRGAPHHFLLVAIGDTTAIEVVYGKLDLDLIAREDLDVVHTHLAGNVSKNGMAVFKLYLKHSVWKSFEYGALQFNCIFFSQGSSFKQIGSQTQMEILAKPLCYLQGSITRPPYTVRTGP